jgi:hypothetical protein
MKKIIGCLLVVFMIVGSIFFVVGNLHASQSELDCFDQYAECLSQAHGDCVNGDDVQYCRWALGYCLDHQ